MDETTGITGRRTVLVVGMWSAWLCFALNVVYFGAVVAAALAYGSLRGPYWAIAEVVVLVVAVILVMLMAAIHDAAPPRSKIFSGMAFGWTLVTAALTITVHFVELTVARRVDARPFRDSHACSTSSGRRCSWL